MSKRRLISFDWAIEKLLRSKANFEILGAALQYTSVVKWMGKLP